MKTKNWLGVACGLIFLAASAVAAPLAETISGDLVMLDGASLKQAPATALKDKKYIAVYYSAHWCPPCRNFTPKLVAFYNERKAAHPEFELVFMSSDRDEKSQTEYMAETKMPWLAVKFDKVKTSPLDAHKSQGIPYMVVLDAEGKVVVGSSEWQSPSLVLKEIDRLLAGK